MKVIECASSAAWKELQDEVGADRDAIQRAQMDLAHIVFGLARVGERDHNRLKHKAVVGYRVTHGHSLLADDLADLLRVSGSGFEGTPAKRQNRGA